MLLPSRSVSSACTSCGLGEVVLSGALFPVTGVIGTAVSLGLLSSGSYWRGWMKPRVFTVELLARMDEAESFHCSAPGSNRGVPVGVASGPLAVVCSGAPFQAPMKTR